MTNREPPKQLVRDVLRQDWNSANTFSLTPSIEYGWFDEYDGPTVLVRELSENALGGGETGYAYMTNGGPGREVDGTISVHAFARTGDDLDSSSDTRFGNRYLWGADAANDGTLGDRGVVREIERIIGNNEVRPSNPITGNTPVRFLSIGNSTPVEEAGGTGPLFHHSIDINYIFADD